MVDKSLCEFSAPTTANIHIRPAVDINGSFELKPALLNMVQASHSARKAHEDASAHLQQHFHYQGRPQRCYTTSPFPILNLGESEAVVLHQQGEEYYVGTMFHQFPGEVLSHKKDQCYVWEDIELSTTT